MKIRSSVFILFSFIVTIVISTGCNYNSRSIPQPVTLEIINSLNTTKQIEPDFINLHGLINNLNDLTKIYTSIFPVDEITSDSAAIVQLHSDVFANSYTQKIDGIEKYWIKFKGFKEVDFAHENFIFLFFHTLPIKEYNSNDSFELADCRWCNGYSSVVRLKRTHNKYVVDELIYDCKCGRRETWGSFEQGKIISIGNEFLILEAENYYWNNPVSISSVNICNALNLEYSRSFYQDGNTEDGMIEAEVKVGVSSYLIMEGRPTIETKIGINKYEDLGGLFGQENPLIKEVSHYITLCCDGTTSYSTGRGTCSWHKGVCDWKYPVYKNVPKYSYY